MRTTLSNRPGTELHPVAREDLERLHIDTSDDIDDDWSVMYCGIVVHFHDDDHRDPGGVTPNIDFYGPRAGYKATCPACLAAWQAAGGRHAHQ